MRCDFARAIKRLAFRGVEDQFNALPVLAAAYWGDLKWTVSVGLAVVAMNVGGHFNVLLDIAVRSHRTNIILRDALIKLGRLEVRR
jgi:hypothetical protein